MKLCKDTCKKEDIVFESGRYNKTNGMPFGQMSEVALLAGAAQASTRL